MYAGSVLYLLAVIVALAVANKETNLLRDLFRSYGEAERSTRGVQHSGDALNATFGMTILNVLDLDTTNGIVTINVWHYQEWVDARLKWKASDYGGVTALRVPEKLIWKPDIVQYNRVSTNVEIVDDVMALVYNTGQVIWIPRATIKCACRRVTTPGQAWNCSVKFGSWTFDGNQLGLDFYEGKEKISLDDFTILENGYGVTAQPAVKHVKIYPCCEEPYIDLYFPFQVTN